MYIQEAIILNKERKNITQAKITNSKGQMIFLKEIQSPDTFSNHYTNSDLMDASWQFIPEKIKIEGKIKTYGEFGNPIIDFKQSIPDNAKIYAEWEE